MDGIRILVCLDGSHFVLVSNRCLRICAHSLVELTGIVHLLLGPFSIVHDPSYTIYTSVARYISTIKNNRSNFEQNRATMLNSFYPKWICIVSDLTENPTFVLEEDLGDGLFHWELL